MPGGCIEQHNTESTDEHYDEMAGNVKMVGSPLTYVGSHSSVRRDRRARLALSLLVVELGLDFPGKSGSPYGLAQ